MTNLRVAGLSSPPAWTSVVQVALFEELMLVVLQANSIVLYKRPFFFYNYAFSNR